MHLTSITFSAQRQALQARRAKSPPRFLQLNSTSRGGEARERSGRVYFRGQLARRLQAHVGRNLGFNRSSNIWISKIYDPDDSAHRKPIWS
jgi:hypothetical protein